MRHHFASLPRKKRYDSVRFDLSFPFHVHDVGEINEQNDTSHLSLSLSLNNLICFTPEHKPPLVWA